MNEFINYFLIEFKNYSYPYGKEVYPNDFKSILANKIKSYQYNFNFKNNNNNILVCYLIDLLKSKENYQNIL